MARNVIVDIEVPSVGRKEHYPTTIENLSSFLKSKIKEFDGDYTKVQSKEINLVRLYGDFDLDSVLQKILSSKKPKTMKMKDYPKCLVLFLIKLKNMDEAKIYVSMAI